MKYVVDKESEPRIVEFASLSSADILSIAREPVEEKYISSIKINSGPMFYSRHHMSNEDIHCLSEIDHREPYLRPQQKILLVDDQIYNLDALEIILKYKLGINTSSLCSRAFNGSQALKMIADNI